MLLVRIVVGVVASGLTCMQIIEAWDNWDHGKWALVRVELGYALLSAAFLVVVAVGILHWGWLA